MSEHLRKVRVRVGVYENEHVVFVPLTRGRRAIVHADDWPNIVAKHGAHWCTISNGCGRHYAARGVRRGFSRRLMTLARAVTKAAKGTRVAYINGDPMDCRRSNLRVIPPKKAAAIRNAFADKRRAGREVSA